MHNRSGVRPPNSILSVSQYAHLLFAVAFVTVAVILAARTAADGSSSKNPIVRANGLSTSRTLYAVNQSSATRGSISVYDIDREHSLVKIIPTVSDVDDVRGVAVSAVTGANSTSPTGPIPAWE